MNKDNKFKHLFACSVWHCVLIDSLVWKRKYRHFQWGDGPSRGRVFHFTSMSKLSSTSVCITQPSFGYSEEYILLLRKSSAYSSAGPGQILDNIKCDKCAGLGRTIHQAQTGAVSPQCHHLYSLHTPASYKHSAGQRDACRTLFCEREHDM